MARLILVTGDKGGVGKSFLARALLDWKLAQSAAIQAFDTDKTNSTLFRFYPSHVQHLDLECTEELDGLLERFKTQDVFLLDCAARTLDIFLKWAEGVDLLECQKQLSFQITLAFVLGPEKDCISILKDVFHRFQSGVDYALILNQAKGCDFSLYQNSNTRKLLLESHQALEWEMPALFEKTVRVLDRLNLSFDQAVGNAEVQLADQSRVRLFREKMKTLFSKGNLWN